MARKTEREIKPLREKARELFSSGMLIKDIAKAVGISDKTIGVWAKKENWQAVYTAKKISRTEMTNIMLNQMYEKVRTGEWTPDQISKAAAAIKSLDKGNDFATIVEVLTGFSVWLEAKCEKEGDIAMLKGVQVLLDEYVTDLASKLPNINS